MSVLQPLALGPNGKSWVSLQKEPYCSPLGHPLGWRKCSYAVPHHREEALIVFLGIYSTLGLGKNFCFVLAASGRPWEGTYRRVGQCFKAALWGHEERPKQCAIAFGLGACGEELGFSPKVTLFFSPRTLIGPTGVLPTNSPLPQGGLDSFFWEFILKLRRKIWVFLKL